MTVTIDVRDDPDHPEGGHALIRFRGASDPGDPVTLTIDPLTEGFDYRGPQRIEVAGRVTPDGFEVAVGPEVVSALPPGIATSLGLEEAGIAADVRWPILAQKAAEPRRRVVQAQTRRVVVAGTGVQAKPPVSRPKAAEPPRTSAPDEPPKPKLEAPPKSPPLEAPPTTDTEATKPLSKPEPDATTGGEVATGDGRGARPPTTGDTGAAKPAETTVDRPKPAETTVDRSKPAVPDRAGAAGWRSRNVAAAAMVAFLAGAGGMGAVWFSQPKPLPGPAPQPAVGTTLPSPYAMLSALPDRSPDGKRVDQSEAKAFRKRGDSAGSVAEATFWHDWATKSLLTGKTNDTAATLSDFATRLAKGRGDEGGDASALAAARFLWEMAALASDCVAMDNIAAALSPEGQAGTDREAAVWRDRATRCRAGTKVAR